ncbi:hypothetical protein HK096_001948, partial [Nowakowskiella sp. JEL0078]
MVQILGHAGISVEVLLLALKYISRIVGLSHSQPQSLTLSSPPTTNAAPSVNQSLSVSNDGEQFAAKISPRELIIATLALAAKWLLDSRPHHSLRIWARIGGLSVSKLITAEKDCLRGLDFQLFCGEEELVEWRNFVVRLVAMRSIGISPKQIYGEDPLLPEKESAAIETSLSSSKSIISTLPVQKEKSTITKLFPKNGVTKIKKNEQKPKMILLKINLFPKVENAAIS